MSNAPKRFAEMTEDQLHGWLLSHRGTQGQAYAALRDAIRAEAITERAPMEDTIATLRTRAERAEQERDDAKADFLHAHNARVFAESALGEARREGAREALTRYADVCANIFVNADVRAVRDREYPATPSGEGVTTKWSDEAAQILARANGVGNDSTGVCEVLCASYGDAKRLSDILLTLIRDDTPATSQSSEADALNIPVIEGVFDSAFIRITPDLARRLLALAQTTTEEGR